MTTRQASGSEAAALARRAAFEAGRELLAARLEAGVSQRASAKRAGVSAAQLSRLERGVIAHPSLDLVYRAGLAVGLRPSLRLYPEGARVRDGAHLRLLERLEHRVAPPLRMAREVPLPLPGDRRAWDARIEGGGRASVEAETKLLDLQAVARRVALKQRDDPESGPVILLVNQTAHNRRVLSEHRAALRSQFPLDGDAILRALREGRVPAAGGILLL